VPTTHTSFQPANQDTQSIPQSANTTTNKHCKKTKPNQPIMTKPYHCMLLLSILLSINGMSQVVESNFYNHQSQWPKTGHRYELKSDSLGITQEIERIGTITVNGHPYTVLTSFYNFDGRGYSIVIFCNKDIEYVYSVDSKTNFPISVEMSCLLFSAGKTCINNFEELLCIPQGDCYSLR
jgi:hypothetical protein